MTDDLAARLLEAQTEFIKAELRSETSLRRLVEDEVDAALAAAEHIGLGEAVTVEQITDTAYKYAVAMPLEGAIPELIGQIAGRIHAHPAARAAAARREGLTDLADAVADLALTRRLTGRVLTSPLTVEACVELVGLAVTGAGRSTEAPAEAPGRGYSARLREGLRNLLEPIRPTLEAGVERVTRAGARTVLTAVSREPEAPEVLRDLLHRNDIDSDAELVTAADVEDVVVTVFEFWKRFRQTDEFAELLAAGIDEFFEVYRDTSLADLLTELGVDRDDLVGEGLRFGPPIVALLDERGVLDAALRRRLAPFYSSPQFQSALSGS